MRKCLILVCCLVCTGCMPYEKIIEKQGIATIIGLELIDENLYKGTISLLQFDRKEEQTSVTISAEGISIKDIRQKLEQRTSHDITSGQLRTLLFDQKIAERGFTPYIKTMQRDSSIGSLTFLAIADSPESIIKNHNYEEYPEMGTYIYQLFDKHQKMEMLINSNLHDFITDLYESGIDPTLPIISNEKGTAPYISGIALFSDDKMVGSIPLLETLYIKLFTNHDSYLGDISISFPTEVIKDKGIELMEKPVEDKIKMTLHPLVYHGEIDLINEEAINLNATISVSISEIQPSFTINTKESNIKLEQIIEEQLNKNFLVLLEELRSLNTDPIGIERKIKSIRKYSRLDEKEFSEVYSALTLKPNINVEIKRAGAID